MATAIDIVNIAFSRIGEDTIGAFAEDSTPARLANLTYPLARDAVLRDHFWNFAMRRAALTALAAAPAWGFTSQYELPTDYLRIRSINDDTRAPHRIEGGMLLTDLTSPVEILYVSRIEDAEQFDPMFVDALATYLSAQWAERVTGSTTLGERLDEEYARKLALARGADGQEDPPRKLEMSGWINARF